MSMGLRYTVLFKITEIRLSALSAVRGNWLGDACDPASHRQHKQTNPIQINRVSLDIVLVDPLKVSFPKLKSVVSSVPSRRLTRWRVWHSHRQHKQTNPIQIKIVLWYLFWWQRLMGVERSVIMSMGLRYTVSI